MKQTHFTKCGLHARQSTVNSKLLKAIWPLPILLAVFIAGCQKDISNAPLYKAPASINQSLAGSANPAPIDLGTAGDFTILSETGISTTGVTSVTGDIGVSPIASTAITGFSLTKDATNQFSTSPIVTGKVYASNYAAPTPTKMTTAISDMKTAFTNANGLSTPPPINEIYAGNISGQTLPSGLYKWGTGVLITNAGVTLSGGADDVWVFQIAKNLTVGNGAIVHLSGGAQAKNVFWVVSGKATLGTSVQFAGNILSKTLISLNTGATVNGRLLAQTAVTLIANTVDPEGQLTVSATKGIVYSAVTISGSGFNGTAANDVVKFNGITAFVSSASTTQLVVTVPLGATTGNITVTANGTTTTSANPFQVLQMVKDGSLSGYSDYKITSMAGDNNGNVYGTASKVDANGNAQSFIFKYDSGAITHFYNTPASNTSGTYTLSNVIVDAQGNINVAQNFKKTAGSGATAEILKISPSGVASVLTGGDPGIVNSSGSNTTEYTDVYSMVTDPQGNLYVATENEIKKITPAGVVTTVTGFNPQSAKYMAVDDAGDLYYSSRTLVNNIPHYSVDEVTPQGAISTLFTKTSVILAIITDSENNVFVSVGGTVNKVFIINTADVVNNLTFPDQANLFLTDDNGNFYTIANTITKYTFK